MILNARLRRQIARNQQKQKEAMRDHPLFPLAMQRFFERHPAVDPTDPKAPMMAMWYAGLIALGSVLSHWWVDVHWRRNLEQYALT